MKTLIFVMSWCILFLASCENRDLDSIIVDEKTTPESVNSFKLERFSEILSKAVNDNADLRTFLKSKALEMVDNDYDVFYPLVKNEIVSEGKTFREILDVYTNNDTELSSLEESLPLLTVYVPELPSGFNAETWNATEEIPFVVPNVVRADSVTFYENGNVKFSIECNSIPGFPILVVKNNERIQKTGTSLRNGSESGASLGNGYNFVNDVFNGTDIKLRSRDGGSQDVPLPLLTAYNEMGVNGYYWQRDNIYYGLTKNQTSGTLNRRFVESISSIAFSPSAYFKMSDQTGDPKLASKIGRGTSYFGQTAFWTEGRFEIRIDVYVNNLSGLGTTLTKYFSALPTDLFDITYTKSSAFGRFIVFYLFVPSINYEKTYHPNINLITWDLSSNGSSWKYQISEVDDTEVITISSTVTSEFAMNFSAETKIGLNFGASAKKTLSNTFTTVVSRSSDDLGTLESNFSDPVLLDPNSRGNFFYYKMSNPMVKMVVSPTLNY